MDAVLAETEVEAYTIANEIEKKNPELLAYIQQSLSEAEESRILNWDANGKLHPHHTTVSGYRYKG